MRRGVRRGIVIAGIVFGGLLVVGAVLGFLARDRIAIQLRLRDFLTGLREGDRAAIRACVTRDFPLEELDEDFLQDLASRTDPKKEGGVEVTGPEVEGKRAWIQADVEQGSVRFNFRCETGEWKISNIVIEGEVRVDAKEELGVLAGIRRWAKALSEGDMTTLREASSRRFTEQVWSKEGAKGLFGRPEAEKAGNLKGLGPKPIERNGETATLRLEDESRWVVFRCMLRDERWRVDDVTLGTDGEELSLRETFSVLLAFRKEESE